MARRSKFNLLLLEEGEYLLDEYAALMITCPAASATPPSPSGEPTEAFLPEGKQRGRLRVCSRSVFFESDDVRHPVVRLAYSAMPGKPVAMGSWPHSTASGALHRMLISESLSAKDTMVLQVREQVEMKAGNVIGPYRTRTFNCPGPSPSEGSAAPAAAAGSSGSGAHVIGRQTVLFALLHMSVPQALAPLQQLWTIQQSKGSRDQPPGYERMAIESLVAPRRDGPFNLSLLSDFREKPLLPASPAAIAVERVFPLVSVPGRIMLTEKALYVQPIALNNVAGSDPVTVIPLRDIRRVMRRKRLQREVGLEIFLTDTSPLAAPGVITPEAAAAGLKPSSPNVNLATLGGLPSFSGATVFFAFQGPNDRNRVYREVLALLRERRAAMRKIGVGAGADNSASGTATSSSSSSFPTGAGSAGDLDDELGDPSPQVIMDTTRQWQMGRVSNYDYLSFLNCVAGRSLSDLTQYHVYPWVLADYTSQTLDLTNPASFRDLSKPVGALNSARLARVQERYREMPRGEGFEPPFFWGTHYSTPGYCLYFLVRCMAEHMLRLQAGAFDIADRMFASIAECFNGVTSTNMDVKELTPQFYAGDGASFLLAPEGLDLGVRQSGKRVGDVVLPPWCYGDPSTFVSMHREALECDHVSARLHGWVDLIFGYKASNKSPHAEQAANVFYYLTYEGAVGDLDAVTDPDKRLALQQQIAEFGQTPRQLFKSPHPSRTGPQIPTQLLLGLNLATGAGAGAAGEDASQDASVAAHGSDKAKAADDHHGHAHGIHRQHHHHHSGPRSSQLAMTSPSSNKRRSMAMLLHGGGGGAGLARMSSSSAALSSASARRSTVRSTSMGMGMGGFLFEAALSSSSSASSPSCFLRTRDGLFFDLEMAGSSAAAASFEGVGGDAEARHPSLDFFSLPYSLDDEEWREVEWRPATVINAAAAGASTGQQLAPSNLSALALAVTNHSSGSSLGAAAKTRGSKGRLSTRLCLLAGSASGEITVTSPLEIVINSDGDKEGSALQRRPANPLLKAALVPSKQNQGADDDDNERAARSSPFFLLQDAILGGATPAVTAVAPLHLRLPSSSSAASASSGVDGSRIVVAASLDGCAYIVDTENGTVLRRLRCSPGSGVTCLQVVTLFCTSHRQANNTAEPASTSEALASWVVVIAAGCSDASISLQTVVLTQWGTGDNGDDDNDSFFYTVDADSNPDLRIKEHAAAVTAMAHWPGHAAPGNGGGSSEGASEPTAAGPSSVHFVSGDASGKVLWFSAALTQTGPSTPAAAAAAAASSSVLADAAAMPPTVAAGSSSSSSRPALQLYSHMPRPPSVHRLILDCQLMGACDLMLDESEGSAAATSPASLLPPSMVPTPASVVAGVTALAWAPPLTLPAGPSWEAAKPRQKGKGGTAVDADDDIDAHQHHQQQEQASSSPYSLQAFVYAATSDGKLAVIRAVAAAAAPKAVTAATESGTGDGSSGHSSQSAASSASSASGPSSLLRLQGLVHTGGHITRALAVSHDGCCVAIGGGPGMAVAGEANAAPQVRLLDLSGFLGKMASGAPRPAATAAPGGKRSLPLQLPAYGGGASTPANAAAEAEDLCPGAYWVRVSRRAAAASRDDEQQSKGASSSGGDGGSGQPRNRASSSSSSSNGGDGSSHNSMDVLVASSSDCVVATLVMEQPSTPLEEAAGELLTIRHGQGNAVRYSRDLCTKGFLELLQEEDAAGSASSKPGASTSGSGPAAVVTSLAFLPAPVTCCRPKPKGRKGKGGRLLTIGADASGPDDSGSTTSCDDDDDDDEDEDEELVVDGGEADNDGDGDGDEEDAAEGHAYVIAVGLKHQQQPPAGATASTSTSTSTSSVHLWAGTSASSRLLRKLRREERNRSKAAELEPVAEVPVEDTGAVDAAAAAGDEGTTAAPSSGQEASPSAGESSEASAHDWASVPLSPTSEAASPRHRPAAAADPAI